MNPNFAVKPKVYGPNLLSFELCTECFTRIYRVMMTEKPSTQAAQEPDTPQIL